MPCLHTHAHRTVGHWLGKLGVETALCIYLAQEQALLTLWVLVCGPRKSLLSYDCHPTSVTKELNIYQVLTS